MANDVERLRDIEADKARKERAWRKPPEQGFADVLTQAPAQGALEDESPDDPRKKKPPHAVALSASSAAAMPGAAVSPAAIAPAQPKPEVPRVPPDPRERLLRAQVARDLASSRATATLDTPATGTHLIKP